MDNQTQTALAEGTFVAYTAGSCKGNPGPGGCAFRLYFPDGQPIEKARHSLDTSNNIAAMWAVIDALEATPGDASVLVCLNCDYIKSNYEQRLVGWVDKGWLKSDGKPVANRELWQRIVALSATRKVAFEKVTTDPSNPNIAHVLNLARDATHRAARRANLEFGGAER